MSIYSPVTASTQVVDSLFAYGWTKATNQLGAMMDAADGKNTGVALVRSSRAPIPVATAGSVDIFGGQNYDSLFDGYVMDLRARFRSLGDEWADIIGRMLTDVMPASEDYSRFVAWLADPSGPSLGDTGRANHEQQLNVLLSQKQAFAQDVLAPLGIVAPARSAQRQADVARAAAAPHVDAAAATFDATDVRLRARYAGDGADSVLAEWQSALGAVRDYLLSRIKMQFAAYSADSPMLTQARLQNLSDETAVRVQGADVQAYEAVVDGAAARYTDDIRRADEVNARARDRQRLFAHENSERIQLAAQQARAALNSNNITVGSGFSERREIDLE